MTAAPAATLPLENPVDEARRLFALADPRGLSVRALGGVAVSLTLPPGGSLLLSRSYGDIDLIIPKGEQQLLDEVITAAGYVPDEEFNAFNGHRRLRYYDATSGRQVDVFVAVFSMCHEIPIGDLVSAPGPAIPVPELLLTKLQVVELNDKDLRDVLNLVYNHSQGPQGSPDELGLERIAACCAADWGLWRTVGINILRTRAALADLPVGDEVRNVLRARLDAMAAAIETHPKTRRWKVRGRIGDRVRWYEEPEEVA